MYLDDTCKNDHPSKMWVDSSDLCQFKAPPVKVKRITLVNEGTENDFLPNVLSLSRMNIKDF